MSNQHKFLTNVQHNESEQSLQVWMIVNSMFMQSNMTLKPLTKFIVKNSTQESDLSRQQPLAQAQN